MTDLPSDPTQGSALADDAVPTGEVAIVGDENAVTGGLDAAKLVAEQRNVYGNDMLYVSFVDGLRVGRLNLRTNKIVLERPDLREDFDAAVMVWRERASDNAAAPASFSDSVAHGVADRDGADSSLEVGKSDGLSGWRDLAENRAGEATRQRARELRHDAPIRTRLFRVLRVHTEERAWRVGAYGEEEVARRLRSLGDSWKILHAVPVGHRGSDIDHVVVGPGGVFTLNSKYHLGGRVRVSGGTVWVNGHRTDYVRNSRFEGDRASRLLSSACGFDIAIQPLIVVMASNLRVLAQPADVYVIGRKAVANWLSARPSVLRSEAVERIFAKARQESTWQGSS